nr:WYL domain-containing protein [Salsipaludibacter albus]
MAGGEDERLAVARLTTHLTEPLDVDPNPALHVSVAEDHLATVAGAVSTRTTLSFAYRRADGAERARTVDPWAIGIRNGVGYLTGWDHDRRDRRVFRLSRIVSRIRSVGEEGSFQRPDDVDLGAELVAPLGEGTDVTVLVEPTAIAAVQAHGGRLVEPADDGDGETGRGSSGSTTDDRADDPHDDPGEDWVVMCFPDSDPVRLAGWLTGVADRVVVVDPPELHDRVRSRLAELLARDDHPEERP